MSNNKKNTVEVLYDEKTLETLITVNGKTFDTSRIDGKEIADWAYPFMMRKVRWNGFYDEMVQALGGQKAFDLVFEGSEKALAELKEAWEKAPVNIISGGSSGSVVTITYDENSLITEITVNGQPFDTSRINGKEIADWVYPFMMRKVKWEGIFEELAKSVGSQEYTIQFSGSNAAMNELMEECPETVAISKSKNVMKTETNPAKSTTVSSQRQKQGNSEMISQMSDKDARKTAFYEKYGYEWSWIDYTLEDKIKNYHIRGLWYQNVEQNDAKADYQFRKSEFYKTYGDKWAYDGGASSQEELAQRFYVRGIWYRDFRGWNSKAQRLFQMAVVLGHSEAENALDFNADNYFNLAVRYEVGLFGVKDKEKALITYEFIQSTWELEGWMDYRVRYGIAKCSEEHAFICFSQDNYEDAIFLLNKAVDFYQSEFSRFNDLYYDNENDWYSEAEYYQDIIETNIKLGSLYARLGLSFQYGELDDETMFNCYKISVEHDPTEADIQDRLGTCYANATGTYEDYDEAVKHFLKAAEMELPVAYYHLGYCYENGLGVPQNLAKARQLLEIGAELGDELSAEELENIPASVVSSSLSTNEIKGAARFGTKIGMGVLKIAGLVTGQPEISAIGQGIESVLLNIIGDDIQE